MSVHRTVGAALALLIAIGCGSSDQDVATDEPFDPETCVTERVVQQQVFGVSCVGSGCHGAGRPEANLDLESPGLAQRLRQRPSQQSACSDRLLITPGVPQTSFMMDKVLGNQGKCGDPMPQAVELDADQRRCLAVWIGSLPEP